MKTLLKIAATFLALGFAIGYASAQTVCKQGQYLSQDGRCLHDQTGEARPAADGCNSDICMDANCRFVEETLAYCGHGDDPVMKIGASQSTPVLLAGPGITGMNMTGSSVISPQLVAAAIGNVSTSISLTQIVVAAPAIPVKLTMTSSMNPSPVGTKITYSGTVVCSNNGAGPTGTITVKGLTGSQTVALGTGGAFTCSETPTVVTAGTLVTATYNSTNAAGTVIDTNCY